MKVKEMLLAQLERESAGTRKALEAVPEGKNDWKPHSKSMSLGSLASLVASMPSWVPMIVEKNELDLATGEGAPKTVKTNRELLQIHESAMESARKALSKAIDPTTRIVVLTGYGSIATAVDAVRLGAVSYLPKPADADDLIAALTRDENTVPLPPQDFPVAPDFSGITWDERSGVGIQWLNGRPVGAFFPTE